MAVVYGFYRVGQRNKEKNGGKLAQRQARFSMAPILQVEADRWYLEREREIFKREAEIMKNVPGWKVGESTFLTDRWVPPSFSHMDKNSKK